MQLDLIVLAAIEKKHPLAEMAQIASVVGALSIQVKKSLLSQGGFVQVTGADIGASDDDLPRSSSSDGILSSLETKMWLSGFGNPTGSGL